jgi:hypothetical protein
MNYRMLTLSDLELAIFCFNCLIDVSEHLNYDLQSIKSQTVLFLRGYDGLVFRFLEFALSDLRERVYGAL